MPQYTRWDSNAMQKEAARRSREMRASVPPRPAVPEKLDFLPLREEQTAARGFGNPMELLQHLDNDQLLILALLYLIYKNDGDKKLLMALAYLLT